MGWEFTVLGWRLWGGCLYLGAGGGDNMLFSEEANMQPNNSLHKLHMSTER